MIPLFKPMIRPESIEGCVEVLRSGWLGLGPKVKEFEGKFAEYVGNHYAVGLNSGTAALQLAVICADLPKGSYVITTPLTFVSTNHVILQAGLKPVFADVEYWTGNISVPSIESILEDQFFKKNVSAIMVVHYGGQPVDMDNIYTIAQDNGLEVIEDAAHACGAKYGNDKIGSHHSKLVAFSFHAVKNLPTGDGGMLVTSDKEIAERAKKLRWLGINKSTADRTDTSKYSWEYTCDEVGFKCHMNDIQAAIGITQLKYLDEDNESRRNLVDHYKERIGRIDDLVISHLTYFKERKSSNHLMVALCKNSIVRDTIMTTLASNGIHTGVHYTPNYYYPMYKDVYRENGCTQTEHFFRRAVSLPLYPELTIDEVDKIMDIIQEVLE